MHTSDYPPAPLPPAMPHELRALPHWVVWQAWHEPGRAKPRKRPFSPRTGLPTGHSFGRRAEWGSFAQACRALAGGRRGTPFAGLGFVLTSTDPFCGIDLDDCLDDRGDVAPHAAALLTKLDSYTELSAGGRGLHVIVRATLPGRGRHPASRLVELYDRDRFFVMSGRPWPGAARPIAARDEIVGQLWLELGPSPTLATAATVSAPLPRLRDDQIVALLRRSTRGPTFSALYDLGDLTRYKHNRSAADLGLANMIAFYSDDPLQIERLMRGSRLPRAKWDEGRSDGTYLGNTIARARRRAVHYGNLGGYPARPRP